MFKAIVSLIIASLFFPNGFNFFSQRPVDSSFAVGNQQKNFPQRIINNNLGIKSTAKSILVVDQQSNTVLYQKDDQAVLPIASITKLVNVLTFLDHNPGWKAVIQITQQDKRNGGLVNLFTDEKVTVKDLFNLTLVSSTNEAAAALARSSGLDNYVEAMNKKAKELGMTGSHFVDVTGLDPKNVSTAHDLVKLAQGAFAQPEIVAAITQETYSFKVLNNSRHGIARATDQLLGSFVDEGQYHIVGAKTGFLDEAGYCLLMMVERADKAKIIVVILGADSQNDRWQTAKGLVDWTFSNYRW